MKPPCDDCRKRAEAGLPRKPCIGCGDKQRLQAELEERRRLRLAVTR